MSTILVTGASGFVGNNIVKTLSGHDVRALLRSAKARPPEGTEAVIGDVTDSATLTKPMQGVDIVIHLVGIIEETGDATFDRVIRQGTQNVVDAAKAANVRHVILMSALGARDDQSLPYMQAKFRGEQSLQQSGLPFTIFRPSVIFGPGDGFINTLAGLVKRAPVTPVVGDGTTKFSPVAVGDVADAFGRVANDPGTAMNEIVEVGGAQTLTYEEMLDTIASEFGRSRPKVHVPLGLMKSVVSLSAPLPKVLRPPVTPEQLKMLSLDNSVSPDRLARLIGRDPLPLAGNIGYIRGR